MRFILKVIAFFVTDMSTEACKNKVDGYNTKN